MFGRVDTAGTAPIRRVIVPRVPRPLVKVSTIVNKRIPRPLPKHMRRKSRRQAGKRNGHEGSVKFNVKPQQPGIHGRSVKRRAQDGLGYAEEGADIADQVGERRVKGAELRLVEG